MDTIFKAFTFRGIKLLAIPQGDDVAIINENGESYGAWMSIGSFKRASAELGLDAIGIVKRIGLLVDLPPA